MSQRKKLWIIPTPIGPGSSLFAKKDVLNSLDVIFCESESVARRYLASQGVSIKNKILVTIKKIDVLEIIDFFERKNNFGLISDAGYPCIADVGAEVVWLAHSKNIDVKPLVGPNSLIMTLASSGFNCNRFEFLGYPPIEARKLKQFILTTQYQANKKTMAFIEAPHRSKRTYQMCLELLDVATLLCVGVSIDSARQQITSKAVADHRRKPVDLDKQPVVFVIAKKKAI